MTPHQRTRSLEVLLGKGGEEKKCERARAGKESTEKKDDLKGGGGLTGSRTETSKEEPKTLRNVLKNT